MKTRDIIRSIVITFGYVLISLAVQYKIDGLLDKYMLFLIAGGAGILLYERIAWKNKLESTSGISVPAMLRVFAYILLFLGIQNYLIQYVHTQWVWFLIAGILIYNYHHKIVDLIAPKEKESPRNFGGGFM